MINDHHRLDIQGLRAIAVLQVAAFHAGLNAPGGFVGVDVFFVISGFVITAMLQREWAAEGRIRFGRFYARRFMRLAPALALVVAVTIAGAVVLLSPFGRQQVAAQTAIGAMLLAANLVIARTVGGYFDAGADANPLLHTWSLSVEEQFYLAFPLLLTAGWWLGRRFRQTTSVPIVLVAGVALVSFGLAVFGASRSPSSVSWLLGFYSPVTRAWEFAAGALLALGGSRLRVRSLRLATLLGIAGVLALASSLWLVSDATPFPGAWTLWPVTGAVLLLLAGTHADNSVSRCLSLRPMVSIGDWSYAIYLWHWPLIVFGGLVWPGNPFAIVAIAVLSVVPAIVSYYWLEQPLRIGAAAGRRRMAVLVLATVLPPIVLATAAGRATRAGWWPAAITTFVRAVTEENIATTRGCFTPATFTLESVSRCQWNATAAGVPVYLVGDSQAWQFAASAIGAGERLDRPVWVFAASSCQLIAGLTTEVTARSPFFPADVDRGATEHCPAYVTFTLRWLEGAPPGVVLIAGSDQHWWDPGVSVSLGDAAPTLDQRAKLKHYRDGLEATVRGLRASGHQVLLVQALPTYRNPAPIWDPSACSPFALQRRDCFREVPLTFIEDLQRGSRLAVSDVAQSTGAAVLDLRDWFCESGRCSTQKNGVPQYRDATHITVPASRDLIPRFADAIGQKRD